MLDGQAWRVFQPAKDGMPDLKNDSGSTAVEYGLIAAGIAIGISKAVSSLGAHVKSTISNFADIASSSSTAIGVAPARLK
jgi:pilus assembly protein Flp/PilA